MKITYIHQHYPKLPHEGGMGRPWEFARRLAADGHEVTLIAGGRESRTTYVENVRIIHVRAPYANEAGTFRRVGAFLLFLLRATVLAVRIPADITFASSTPLTVAVPGMIGALVQRSRFVFEVRDLWPAVPIELGYLTNPLLQSLARRLEWLVYRRADTVIALSGAMAKGVRDVNNKVPLVIIPNASDFALFPPDIDDRDEVRAAQGWSSDETVLVYAGGFGRTYRLQWVVDLAAELRAYGIRVAIYGHGSALATLRQQAEALELDVDTLLPGRLGRQDLARVVAAADATISSLLPARCLEANSLNKVFESMAARKAVFFNHDGWLTELVTARGGGWRLNNDPATAAREVYDVSTRQGALESAGECNGDLGRERFDRDKLYLDFRRAVIGS